MAGAPTIALKTGGSALTASTPTVGLKPPGSPTVGLPKATVQLQPPTLPIGSQSPSQMATLQIDEEEVEAGTGLINGLAIFGFVAAAVVLAIQLMMASTWISAEDNQSTSGWAQLIE
jgi:hypothetical protein